MTLRPLVLPLAILPLLPAQGERKPIADYHQHLFSPAIAARSTGVEPIDAAQLVRLLDAAGIRRALVLSLAYQFGNPNRPPVENEYDHVKAENNWTSEQAARFADRLRAFAFAPRGDGHLRRYTCVLSRPGQREAAFLVRVPRNTIGTWSESANSCARSAAERKRADCWNRPGTTGLV